MGKPLIDLTGKRFGRLTVLEKAGYDGKSLWRCKCDCGAESIARSPNLRSGRHVSCGCHKVDLVRERLTRHGHARVGAISRTYKIWENMNARCSMPSATRWKDYGGRGIRVCEAWQTFDAFLADMGECPDGLTLDRIDVNGNYSPDNCRWATYAEQMRNKRNNVFVDVGGVRMVREDARKALGMDNRQINRLIEQQRGGAA